MSWRIEWQDVGTRQELDDALAQPGLQNLKFGGSLKAKDVVAVLHRLASLE